MSNDLIPANIKLPAHLANRLNTPSQLGSSISAGISAGASMPRISTKGSRFRIVEGGTTTVLPDLSLDVVIVGANPALTKLWFEKEWDADAPPDGPDCYSLDGRKPAGDAKKKQSDLCATCPQNQWGSKIIKDKKLKACADQKRLAVVANADPSGPIYLLQVTPAALKGLNEYHKSLSMRGIPAEVVMTKLSFDTDASFPKLKFSFGGFLSPETQAVVDDLFGSEAVLEVTGETAAVATVEVAKPLLVTEVKKPEPIVVEAEPAPEQPKRGFGSKKAEVAAPTPAPKARVVKEPVEAPVANNDADDIASLLDSLGFDDEQQT